MIATACDYRLMVTGKAKISLNERLNFGSSVFAGTVAMLSHSVGSANAGRVLLSGKMHSAEEALELGLIDQVTSTELPGQALKAAKDLAGKDSAAFRSIKHLLRGAIAEEMLKREGQSIREFVDIWYSEKTWKNLQLIKITD